METRRVLITGCNRGIGKALANLLAHKHPTLNIHITSRHDPQQLAQEYRQTAPEARINCHHLDIDHNNSIKKLVADFGAQSLRLDRIVANAGVGVDYGLKMPSLEIAERFTKTNFLSTIDFIKQSLPLLNDQGRVVIVSGIVGTLQKQPEYVKSKLTNPNITEKQLIQLAKEYVEAVRNKDMKNFSLGAYGTSKALLNAWIRFVMPKYLKREQSAIAMHPGWCKTDMGGPKAPLTPEQGAASIYECLVMKNVEPDRFFNQKFCSYETCQ